MAGRLMSIWATWLSFDDEDHDDCSDASTCRCGPSAYQGSHIMPDDDADRVGTVDVAAIPAFVLTNRQGVEQDDDERVLPWLRLAVGASTTILDRAQARRLYHTLGDWLMRCQPSSPPTPEGT